MARPCLHERPALFENIIPPIGALDCRFHDMPHRLFDHGMRKADDFLAPCPKRRAKSVWDNCFDRLIEASLARASAGQPLRKCRQISVLVGDGLVVENGVHSGA
jgi:hypothetical protein